jgi:hypothetical protein
MFAGNLRDRFAMNAFLAGSRVWLTEGESGAGTRGADRGVSGEDGGMGGDVNIKHRLRNNPKGPRQLSRKGCE